MVYILQVIIRNQTVLVGTDILLRAMIIINELPKMIAFHLS